MKGRIQDLVEAIRQIVFSYQIKPVLISRSNLITKPSQKDNKNCFFLSKKIISNLNHSGKIISHISKENILNSVREQKRLLPNCNRRANHIDNLILLNRNNPVEDRTSIIDSNHDLGFKTSDNNNQNYTPLYWTTRDTSLKKLKWGFKEGSFNHYDLTDFPKLNAQTTGFDKDSRFAFLAFGKGNTNEESFFSRNLKTEKPLKIVDPDQFIGQTTSSKFKANIWFEVGYQPKLSKNHPFGKTSEDSVASLRRSKDSKFQSNEEFDQSLYEVDCKPVRSPIRKVNFFIKSVTKDIEYLSFDIYTTTATHPVTAFHYARGKAISLLQSASRNPISPG
jgi:hypothetical protein